MQESTRPIQAARLSFNLEDVSLSQLLTVVGELTGRHFIQTVRRPRLRITVVSPTRLARGEVYRVFLSVLESHGLTAVSQGRFEKIIASQDVERSALKTLDVRSVTPDNDHYYTRLVRLRFEEASSLVKLLSRFKTKSGDVSVAGERLLVITDTGQGIRRMIRLVEEFDTSKGDERLWVEPIRHRSAKELSQLFSRLYTLEKDAELSHIYAEEASNSLIIQGREDGYLALKAQLLRLDRKNDGSPRKLRVVGLRHADAEAVAKVIGELKLHGKNGKAALAGLDGSASVTADPQSNSLVISSSPHDFARLELAIIELDQPRSQVFIEAAILDLSVSRAGERALGAHVLSTSGEGPEGTLVLAGFDPRRSLAPTAAELQALSLAVRGPALDFEGTVPGASPGASAPGFAAVLSAIERSGRARVLGTPHLLVMDNADAEIQIGENVPLQTGTPTGQTSLGGLAPGLLSQINFDAQRRDVGTILHLAVQINREGDVRLVIDEEISEVGAPSGRLGTRSVRQRSAKTTVTVADGQSVVIGGLSRRAKSRRDRKIPLLGDIPLVGALFRNTETGVQRSNLLLLLTPTVVRDQEDLRRIFRQRMRERQAFLDRRFVQTAPFPESQDFERGVGLVEDIRQAISEQEARAQLISSSDRAAPKVHPRSEGLELPMEVREVGKARKRVKKKKRAKRRKERRRRRKNRR